MDTNIKRVIGVEPTASQGNKPPLSDQISRVATLLAFLIAVVSVFLGLISALRYSEEPFPGFLVEQTLVVSNISSTGWTGNSQGLSYPMRIIRINGVPIKNQAEFKRMIYDRRIGQKISVEVTTPDGQTQNFNSIELIAFPANDFLKLFWLPYSIGVIYLLLGFWVYWIRGDTPAGRAFVYFAACSAIVNLLLFDLWTSHAGTIFWTVAIAQIGGAVIVLSVLLPTSLTFIAGIKWVRILGYGISILLSIAGLALIYNLAHPWAYVLPWRYSYIYAFLGLVTFIASMIFRLRSNPPSLVKQQVRIILWGGLIAFTPIGIWFALQVFYNTPFDPLVLTTFLLIFPVSIAIAMMRYRMWDFDLVIRRTLTYLVLTGFLIVVYLLLVIGLGNLVNRYTGIGNLFNVVATLVVVLIFTPLMKFVQRIVDRLFYKDRSRLTSIQQRFQEKLRTQVDLDELNDDLIDVIQQIVDPTFVSLWVPKPGRKEGNDNV